MLRRCSRLLVGVESDVFTSRIHDKKFVEARLQQLGKIEAEAAEKPLLTQEELNRFTSSASSKEHLFNKEVGAEPTNIVDEATGQVIGSTMPDPTRYGDWEVNGRCYDF